MIVNRLTEKLDFQGPEQLRNKHRLLFLIDEFPHSSAWNFRRRAFLHGRFGLKAYLITQDIRQIVDEYGRNESISAIARFASPLPHQYDTAELLRK